MSSAAELLYVVVVFGLYGHFINCGGGHREAGFADKERVAATIIKMGTP